MKSKRAGNPFRIHGIVTGEYFTDREVEVARVMKSLAEGGSKLLVYGPRRMGKTSVLANAVAQINGLGGHAFLADLSTASSVADIANRILASANEALGRRWKDVVAEIARRIKASMTLKMDPNSGTLQAGLDVALRGAELEEQRTTLGNVLDALDSLARERSTTIGIVLDEFQEIDKFGETDAEWHLRGVIQHHQHVGYVLAGSKTHLIERMTAKNRAFFGMLDILHFGPMDTAHLARWIEKRMASAGVRAEAVGLHVVTIAGPRTRDIVRVARHCHDGVLFKGWAEPEDVHAAFEEIVDEEHDLFYGTWESLTAQQQNVLRAVAGGRRGLTTRETLKAFALGSSGTTANTAAAMMKSGLLLKNAQAPTGYTFDNPFFERWVALHALPDIGPGLSAGQ